MEYRIFIALGFICLLVCTEHSKENANEEIIIDTVFTYYKNGKIKFVEFQEKGKQVGGKYFDKNGVLLTEGFKNERTMISYYKDGTIFKKVFYHKFDKPDKDGSIAREDSVLIYKYNPNQLVFKSLIKNDNYHIIYYEDNRPIRKDSIIFLSSGPILKDKINKSLGKDSLIEKYVPDVLE